MKDQTNEELITAYVEKHSARNLYLAGVRARIKRKGFSSLSANEVTKLLKRIKDKDGALPFDYEQFKEGGFLE